LSLCSSVALADTYQAEAGVTLDNFDSNSRSSSYNTYTFNGSLYFNPVDASKGPRAEAAFLSRASDISASYTDSNNHTADGNYNLDTRVVVNSNLVLEAGYADFNFDKAFRLGMGTYVSDHADVVVSYSKTDNSNLRTLEAAYHSVLNLVGTSSLGYTASVAYINPPVGNNGYALSADATYYLNPSVGVGGVVSHTDLGLSKNNTFGVQASYFITPVVFVRGYVQTIDYDNGPNERNIGINASLRF
jgi:hypothetical protein